MKYAILSDIHGNLEALTTVLDKCRELGVDEYISLGDIVGYNANPKECLDMMRSLNLACAVKGNHDEYAAGSDNAIEGFNPHARAAVIWTKSHLPQEDRLRGLRVLHAPEPCRGESARAADPRLRRPLRAHLHGL